MRMFFCLFIFLCVSACSTFEVQNAANNSEKDFLPGEVLKGPNDKRIYRSLILPNQLEVMLISDPETDKAAASMDVLVGSANDPAEFAGLAHFLEHMLFLGTEKYPEADAYQKYISEHGGRHNAYTSSEHTNYFFEVSKDYLEGALDRFSQQFTVPLFNEDYVSREINAVHSEYTSKLKDDGRRYFSAVKETLADDHPYSKFSVGNLETLSSKGNEALRNALLDFYAEHYSANLMKLVIIGKEPLDELERLAKAKFSDIPNKNIVREKISVDYFEPNFLPAKLSVQSIKDTRSLSIGFPIPSPQDHIHSKPVSYLANLIGHEGNGSLLSALKANQLADSLSAGVHFDTGVKAIFSVNMSLTQKGLAETDKILEYFFAYLDLIKAAMQKQAPMQKTYFDEMSQMLDISFRFQEKSAPMNYARAIADALHRMSARDVLVKGYQLNDYRPDLYQDYLDRLTPDNMIISVSEKSIEGTAKTPWYETPYSIEPISAELVQRLEQVERFPELELPEKNIFIPENVSFIDADDNNIPSKIYQASGIELWHAVDKSFGTPKSNLFVTIRSPEAMTSAKSLNSLEIMVSLLKDALNEFSYPAYLGGLNYELYNHVRGVTIKISGYSDKQALLLKQILEYLQSKSFTQERFAIIKENLQRSLENQSKRKPYEQAIALAQETMLHPSWSSEERLAALDAISLEQVESFRSLFFSKLQIAVLSTGNISETKSIEFGKQLENTLLGKAERLTVPRSEALKLDDSATLINSKNVPHPDVGFVFYVQGASKEYTEQARFSLISQLISSDYYNDLRTEKQLGYVVFATHFPVQDVPGIGFIIQSPVASGIDLYSETLTFLTQQKARLSQLEPEQFERAKVSVISKFEKKDNRLYERSNRFWREIDRENAAFDTREQIISAIKQLNQVDVVQYFEQLVDAPSQKLLVYTVNEELNTPAPTDLKQVDSVDTESREYF